MGVTAHWSGGAREWRRTGVTAHWSGGAREWRRMGVAAHGSGGAWEWRRTGVGAHGSGGAREWGRIGVAAHGSGGAWEWRRTGLAAHGSEEEASGVGTQGVRECASFSFAGTLSTAAALALLPRAPAAPLTRAARLLALVPAAAPVRFLPLIFRGPSPSIFLAHTLPPRTSRSAGGTNRPPSSSFAPMPPPLCLHSKKCEVELTASQLTAAQLTAAQLTAAQLTASQLTASQLTASQLTASQPSPPSPLSLPHFLSLPTLTAPDLRSGEQRYGFKEPQLSIVSIRAFAYSRPSIVSRPIDEDNSWSSNMAEPWLAAAAAVEAVKDRGSQWRVGRGSRQVGMGEKSETVENVCLLSRHPSPPANPFFPPVSFIYIPLSHPILNPPSSSLSIAPNNSIAPSGTTSPSLPHHPVFPSMLLSPSSPAQYFCPPVLSAPPPYLARAACSSRFALEAWRSTESGGQSGCVGWAEIIDDAWGGDYGGCVGCCPWVERVEWPGAVGKLDIGKRPAFFPYMDSPTNAPTKTPTCVPHPHLVDENFDAPTTLPSTSSLVILLPIHITESAPAYPTPTFAPWTPVLCRGRTVRPHSSTVEAADVAEVHERLQAKLGEAGLLGASWWCLRSDEQRKEEVHSDPISSPFLALHPRLPCAASWDHFAWVSQAPGANGRWAQRQGEGGASRGRSETQQVWEGVASGGGRGKEGGFNSSRGNAHAGGSGGANGGMGVSSTVLQEPPFSRSFGLLSTTVSSVSHICLTRQEHGEGGSAWVGNIGGAHEREFDHYEHARRHNSGATGGRRVDGAGRQGHPSMEGVRRPATRTGSTDMAEPPRSAHSGGGGGMVGSSVDCSHSISEVMGQRSLDSSGMRVCCREQGQRGSQTMGQLRQGGMGLAGIGALGA
ncbi:unnamed protein product [Closterium sp. NIES-64]|nr:unnamed protein product [Closterium sp. NIES-64]